LRLLLQVIAPMVWPGLLTAALIVGLHTWNEFLIAATFLQDDQSVTAVVRFYNLTGEMSGDWGEIMAAAVLIVLPIVALFIMLQRRFIEGMAAGSVKG
jgi:raffinose/stachyose/melibiose transport system permease protein